MKKNLFSLQIYMEAYNIIIYLIDYLDLVLLKNIHVSTTYVGE